MTVSCHEIAERLSALLGERVAVKQQFDLKLCIDIPAYRPIAYQELRAIADALGTEDINVETQVNFGYYDDPEGRVRLVVGGAKPRVE